MDWQIFPSINYYLNQITHFIYTKCLYYNTFKKCLWYSLCWIYAYAFRNRHQLFQCVILWMKTCFYLGVFADFRNLIVINSLKAILLHITYYLLINFGKRIYKYDMWADIADLYEILLISTVIMIVSRYHIHISRYESWDLLRSFLVKRFQLNYSVEWNKKS